MQNFLKKDITVKKLDNTFVRGICVQENDLGITLNVFGHNVFIPYLQVSEITTKGDA